MQIAKAFDKDTLKAIGISLLKTIVAAAITWLGSNVGMIGSAIKDPSVAVTVTLVIRTLITVADEWYKGQKTAT